MSHQKLFTIPSLYIYLLISIILTSCSNSVIQEDIDTEADIYTPILTFSPNRQIAHRGYWFAGADENSIQAVKYAMNARLYGAEIDIYETADNVIVVNHDSTFNNLDIPNSSYEQLTKDSEKDLPILEDFLELICNSPNFKLIIEIKSIKDLNLLLQKIDKYNIAEQIEFISFIHYYCEALISLRPSCFVACLATSYTPQELANKGYKGIDLQHTYYSANPNIIKEAKALGLTVYTWTVNDAELMNKLYDMGVDRITTDIPRLSFNPTL